MVPIDKCGGCRAIQANKEVLVRTEILDARSVSVCERDIMRVMMLNCRGIQEILVFLETMAFLGQPYV